MVEERILAADLKDLSAPIKGVNLSYRIKKLFNGKWLLWVGKKALCRYAPSPAHHAEHSRKRESGSSPGCLFPFIDKRWIMKKRQVRCSITTEEVVILLRWEDSSSSPRESISRDSLNALKVHRFATTGVDAFRFAFVDTVSYRRGNSRVKILSAPYGFSGTYFRRGQLVPAAKRGGLIVAPVRLKAGSKRQLWQLELPMLTESRVFLFQDGDVLLQPLNERPDE